MVEVPKQQICDKMGAYNANQSQLKLYDCKYKTEQSKLVQNKAEVIKLIIFKCAQHGTVARGVKGCHSGNTHAQGGYLHVCSQMKKRHHQRNQETHNS